MHEEPAPIHEAIDEALLRVMDRELLERYQQLRRQLRTALADIRAQHRQALRGLRRGQVKVEGLREVEARLQLEFERQVCELIESWKNKEQKKQEYLGGKD